MAGGSKDIVQKNEPPAYVQPFLNDVLGRGQNLSNTFTQQYFPQSTVAPISPYTEGAVAQMAALGGSPANQNIMGNAMQGLNRLAGGSPVTSVGASTVPGTTNVIDFAQRRAGQAGPNLGPVNSGSSGFENSGNVINFASRLNGNINQTPGSNPYTDEVVRRTLSANNQAFQEGILPSIQNSTQFAGGFGGSRQGIAEGLAANNLVDTNARTAAQMYASAYESDANRQLQSLGLGAQVSQNAAEMGLQRLNADRGYGLNLGTTGEQIAQGRTNQALSASTLGSNLFTTGVDQDLRGGQAAALTAPGVQNMLNFGPQNLAQAGQADFGYRQGLLTDAINRFDFAQQQPYNAQQQYISAVYGLPNLGGNTQTQSGASGSAAVGALGGAVAGTGLAASTGMLTSAGMTNPMGWAMIAGMALLGGLSA